MHVCPKWQAVADKIRANPQYQEDGFIIFLDFIAKGDVFITHHNNIREGFRVWGFDVALGWLARAVCV